MEKEVLEFLIKAKKQTYAGNGSEVTASRMKSHDLRFSDGIYTYYDTYLGGERFIGEEALWINDIPYWGMNYAGRSLNELFTTSFLKTALSQVSPDMPFRGPALFEKDGFTYRCEVNGDMEWFDGKEIILHSDKLIYECLFQGGLING